ncbi:MAG TPA: family 10 glycosylhydrolase [Candidatus Saccharimonadales bacterium]|nr:family 10 glycosylhydrolase [Candidatus Saccharimonadales bacterium]
MHHLPPSSVRGGLLGRLAAFGALLAAVAAGLAALAGAASPALADEPGPGAGREEIRGLWVVRTSMTSRERIRRMVERARQYGVRDLFVQVRGRADAYYRSAVEPRAESVEDSAFDPLAYALELAHREGLRVHAWLNTFLVWSADQNPRSPAHLANAHPDWSAVRPDGRALWSLTRNEFEGSITEGMFSAAGNPDVRAEFLDVVRDLLRRYDVDGVHLDYVRYPSSEVGFDYGSRTEFMRRTGVDPAWMADRPEYLESRYGPAGVADLERRWADWQRETVTDVVRGVRAAVDSLRPGTRVSAAVIADLDAALGRNRQDWPEWLRAGLLDFAVPMLYTPSDRVFAGQLRRILEQAAGRPVVAGVAVYDQPARGAARKIVLARRMGVDGISLFSYDAIADQPSYWQTLRGAYVGLSR